jgi:hypothetical protein
MRASFWSLLATRRAATARIPGRSSGRTIWRVSSQIIRSANLRCPDETGIGSGGAARVRFSGSPAHLPATECSTFHPRTVNLTSPQLTALLRPPAPGARPSPCPRSRLHLALAVVATGAPRSLDERERARPARQCRPLWQCLCPPHVRCAGGGGPLRACACLGAARGGAGRPVSPAKTGASLNPVRTCCMWSRHAPRTRTPQWAAPAEYLNRTSPAAHSDRTPEAPSQAPHVQAQS